LKGNDCAIDGNFVLQELIENGHAMKSVSLPRARHPLHSMPTSTGYDLQTSSSYVWDGRARGQTPFTVLQHTISGVGTLRYENRVMKVRPGEAMLVIVPHNHRYWVEPGESWEFFWISMHGREALRIHEMILNARGPVVRLNTSTIDRLATCCLRLIQGQGEMPGAASAIAYEAAMALFDDTFGPAEIFPASENSLARAVQYVAANLNRELDVDVLAKVAGLSRAHFSRSFAEMTGLAPAQYVLQERMKRAAKLLLANRDVPVKEIAALTGIPDNNYFAKVFRRTYGISPTDFRTTGMYATNR
jgi:AraC-like DNA-binding protein